MVHEIRAVVGRSCAGTPDAVFVRPTIWSVLRYLHGADPAKYRREIETLMHAEPRLHVRYLLINFLGQVSIPEKRSASARRAVDPPG